MGKANHHGSVRTLGMQLDHLFCVWWSARSTERLGPRLKDFSGLLLIKFGLFGGKSFCSRGFIEVIFHIIVQWKQNTIIIFSVFPKIELSFNFHFFVHLLKENVDVCSIMPLPDCCIRHVLGLSISPYTQILVTVNSWEPQGRFF